MAPGSNSSSNDFYLFTCAVDMRAQLIAIADENMSAVIGSIDQSGFTAEQAAFAAEYDLEKNETAADHALQQLYKNHD